MRTSIIRWWSLVAALGLVVASCGGDTTGDGTGSTTAAPVDTPPAVTFDGTAWTITGGTIDGGVLVALADYPSTFAVNAGRVTGSTGCNAYDATLTIDASGSLAMTGFTMTEIGCDPAVMDFEADVLAILQGIDRFTWDGNLLTLSNGDGTITLQLAAAAEPADTGLVASSWTLAGLSIGDRAGSVVAGTDVYLVLDPDSGALRGNGGCNDFGAGATYGNGTLTVADLTHTEIACDTAIMRQEANVFSILAGATTWQMEDEKLVVATADGDELTFAPRADES